LTVGLATLPACGPDDPARQVPDAAAAPSARVPADKQQVAAQWDAWKSGQRLTGPDARPDFANPAQMNHFTWYQAHDWKRPYSGEDRIFAPAAVPGAYLPPAEQD
ncbi:phosphoesterase, partial [Actinoplanes sp. NPDC026623]